MIIGADYEKMTWKWGEWILMEPNTLLTDCIMAIVCFYLAFRLWKNRERNPFVNWFKAFFITLGISSFTGGIGHACFAYSGTPGKIPGWIAGIFAVFFIEQAMISFVQNRQLYKIYRGLSYIKVVFVIILFAWIYQNNPVQVKPELAFLPIAVNTIFGMFLSAGILGLVFYRKHQAPFHFFAFGVMAMVPAAFVFLMKINVHPWFDKNDISHVLISIGNVFFYVGILKVSPELAIKFNTESEA